MSMAQLSGIDFYKRPAFANTNTEWPKKMYTLFTHQYLRNKFK